MGLLRLLFIEIKHQTDRYRDIEYTEQIDMVEVGNSNLPVPINKSIGKGRTTDRSFHFLFPLVYAPKRNTHGFGTLLNGAKKGFINLNHIILDIGIRY
jgi:hypothetical protein